MNKFIAAGAVLLILGLLTFVVPIFTTQQTTEIAKLGDLKLQSTEKSEHVIPSMLSGTMVVAGVLLLLTGISRKRA